jgi:8-oxo-dGTP pyrophosphatase MutT (NUDIX family)
VTEDIGRKFEIPEHPRDRLRRLRRAVRVILVDERDRLLLFEDSDPGVPGVTWWATPGGGVDPGESERQTAVREVAEETGYVLREDQLVGPLARRRAVHGYSDQILDQEEPFYLAVVPEFEIDTAAHTEEERLTLQGHRWWTRADLEATDAWIWPAELLALWDRAADLAQPPLDLGVVETESTVPLEAD